MDCAFYLIGLAFHLLSCATICQSATELLLVLVVLLLLLQSSFNCLGCPVPTPLRVSCSSRAAPIIYLSSRKPVSTIQSFLYRLRSPRSGLSLSLSLPIHTRFSLFPPPYSIRSDNMVGSISQQYERKHKVTVVGSGNWYVQPYINQLKIENKKLTEWQGMRYRQDRRRKCCQQPVALRGGGPDVGV